jgi:hypothetical protein
VSGCKSRAGRIGNRDWERRVAVCRSCPPEVEGSAAVRSPFGTLSPPPLCYGMLREDLRQAGLRQGYNVGMSRATVTTGNQLTDALQALGVRFLMGGDQKSSSLHKQPRRLIAALAESREARLRLSLIPLFLEHPEFSVHVRAVAKNLHSSARLTLQCYYSAAVWLRRKHQPRRKPMPDYFSRELKIQFAANPEENLRELARRHRELSGAQVNWLGTYQHAAQVWLKGLELQDI